ncbi:MAG: nucleotidyltransferase family protein [Campylobacteraceae bacterium]|nr:nucleotidyltransferase family protein [Campylobacteraceae bacterium]
MTKAFILNFLNEHKKELNEKYGITKIGLFGSYARDEQTDESDIDLACEMTKEKKTLHTFLQFKREMEAVFGKKVDLGIESTLKPIAREYIQKEIIYV